MTIRSLQTPQPSGGPRPMLESCPVGRRLNQVFLLEPAPDEVPEAFWARQEKRIRHLEGSNGCTALDSCASCPMGRRHLVVHLTARTGALEPHVDAIIQAMTSRGPERALPAFCPIGRQITAALHAAEEGDEAQAEVALFLDARYGCSTRGTCLECSRGAELAEEMLSDVQENGLSGEWGAELRTHSRHLL